MESRVVYYCKKCDRYTDVRYISDKPSSYKSRPKSYCYKCWNEMLTPCVVEFEENAISTEQKIPECQRCGKKEVYSTILCPSCYSKTIIEARGLNSTKKGCGKKVKLFYSNAEYEILCGEVNPISRNVVYCKECEN